MTANSYLSTAYEETIEYAKSKFPLLKGRLSTEHIKRFSSTKLTEVFTDILMEEGEEKNISVELI